MKDIDFKKLEGKSILVCAPIFAGQGYATFNHSIQSLQKKAAEYKFKLEFHFIMNESLVQRGRNTLAHEFMASDYTHLMFIDADIGFNPDDIFKMLCWEKGVIGGAYTKKTINWQKVHNAVLNGVRPEHLHYFAGDFAVNMLSQQTINYDKFIPFEVKHVATGFMLIDRKCLEGFQKAFPDHNYRNNHFKDGRFQKDPHARIWAYFDCGIETWENKEVATYLSEDYWFCAYMTKMGEKLWIAPWVYLTHTGTFVYSAEFGCSHGPVACANPVEYRKFLASRNQTVSEINVTDSNKIVLKEDKVK